MGGGVSGRGGNNREIRMVPGSGGGKPLKPPTPEEVTDLVRRVAREVALDITAIARQDVGQVAQVMGHKIAELYNEEVKTAIMLNSLVEILIEKGVLTKEEFKARVTKNEAETNERYKAEAQALRAKAQQQGGAHADGRQQAVGGQHFHRPGESGPEAPRGGGHGLPPEEPKAD